MVRRIDDHKNRCGVEPIRMWHENCCA